MDYTILTVLKVMMFEVSIGISGDSWVDYLNNQSS